MGKSKYSILIVCEGENTEPSFFNSIRDKIISQEYTLDAAITIKPEPKILKEEPKSSNKHRTKRKKRILKKALGEEPWVAQGIPPLNWVESGIEELNTGAYNEVWIVFDHDNHPKRKEAFELAESVNSNGNFIKIAFSSRSFEYFLLLHFEQIHKAFLKTDCSQNNIKFNCGTNSHPDDCGGDYCINGYARVKNYWKESKGKDSLYPKVEARIEIGMDNAAWLRHKSEEYQSGIPIYNRNPYTSVDYLISSLTMNPIRKWINKDSVIHGISISKINDNCFVLENKGKGTLIVQEGSFFICNVKENIREYFGDRLVLDPNQQGRIEIQVEYVGKIDYIGYCTDKKNFLFSLD